MFRVDPPADTPPAERRALVVLAARWSQPTGPGADTAGAARLAGFRDALQTAAGEAGGVLIGQLGAVTVFAWGLAEGGFGLLQRARSVAVRMAAAPGAPAIGVEAGTASVWRTTGGRLLLVDTDAERRALHLAEAPPPHQPALGLTLRALLGRRTAQISGPAAEVAALLTAARRVGHLEPPPQICRCLAVIGAPLDVSTLAALTSLPQAEVRRALHKLATEGAVQPTDKAWRLATRLRPGLLLMVRAEDRAALRAAYAAHLDRGAGTGVTAASAGRIARAAEQGGCWPLALAWWRRADRLAAEAAEPAAALRALDRAVRIATTMPEAMPSEDRLELLCARATLLGTIRGNADPEVIAAYKTARDLLHRHPGHSAQRRFDVLFGLQALHLVRGEIAEAGTTAVHLLDVARRSDDDGLLTLAHRLTGLTQFLDGELGAAIGHYRKSLALYVEDRHADLRFRYASDQKALALAGLAWAEAIAGHASQSAATAAAADGYARHTGHPHTMAHVACVLAVRAQMLGEGEAAATLALQAHDTATQHGLVYWRAWADVLLGWFEAHDTASVGLNRIEAGIADYMTTGARQALPFLLLLKADAEIRGANLAKAGVTLARAERYTRRGGVAVYRSEVLRAAARVAAEVQGRSAAAHLARKAYRIAATQSADLFCGKAVAQLAAITAGEPPDLQRLVRAVKQNLTGN
jgi:hypothetical protein